MAAPIRGSSSPTDVTRGAGDQEAPQMAALFRKDQGAGETPVVLLHGFGGSHAAWDATLAAVGDARRTIAFDLPGHAGSLDHPHGGAGKAARSVLAALAARGISRAHLVGHSMGGAAAALAALMEPARAASLTLLAPGGFGPEANQMLLRRYASASGEAEITQVLERVLRAWRDAAGRAGDTPGGGPAPRRRDRGASTDRRVILRRRRAKDSAGRGARADRHPLLGDVGNGRSRAAGETGRRSPGDGRRAAGSRCRPHAAL